MSIRLSPAVVLCLFSLGLLSLAALSQAQEEPKAPTLPDAKTYADVMAYVQYEGSKLNAASLDLKEKALQLGNILTQASGKLLEVAEQPFEKMVAYQMKFTALASRAAADAEGAEQQFETFFKELTAMAEFKEMEDRLRFMYLMIQHQIRGAEATEPKIEAFIKELAAKEKNEQRTSLLYSVRFALFQSQSENREPTPENFAKFKAELKTWIDEEHLGYIPFSEVVSLGFQVAHENKISAGQFARELTEHIQTLTLDAEDKKALIDELAKSLKFAPGEDPKLYGKTLDDRDFNWENLRGKYVLIKFTATWCGPCKMQIPSMLDAYNRYKDRGLEIVSVYMWEYDEDPAALVKAAVAEEKLPWIILSEALTVGAGKPAYADVYAINGVPTFVLADREGQVMMPTSHSDEWRAKLKEIFE